MLKGQGGLVGRDKAHSGSAEFFREVFELFWSQGSIWDSKLTHFGSVSPKIRISFTFTKKINSCILYVCTQGGRGLDLKNF